MADKKTSIGGQALIEGIMMRGPEKTAMAVRNAAGEIVVDEWATKTDVPKIWRLPILRGMYAMVTSYAIGYKCLMRSADISISDIEKAEDEPKDKAEEAEAVREAESDETVRKSESVETAETADDSAEETVAPTASDTDKPNEKSEPKVVEGGSKSENKALLTVITIIGVVLGVALAVFLFAYIPALAAKAIFRSDAETLSTGAALLRSALEGVIKIALLILYMWAVSQMKDIKRTFMYHGAEHKTIFCYEQGLPLTVENIRKQRRFHPRCGTSFIILMLLVGILIGFFIRIDNVALRALVRIALLPLTVGIGYELIKFAGRHDNVLTKIISAPGMWLQHITTKEPDDSMIECAIEAMNRVIPEDKSKDNW